MALARKLVGRVRPDRLLTAGCSIAAFVALLMLTIAAPPAQVWYQALCCFVTGLAAGLINIAVLESIGPAWEADPAGVTLRGGIYFGAGSVGGSLLMAKCFGGGDDWRYKRESHVAGVRARCFRWRRPRSAFRRLPAPTPVRSGK